jgi:hypothetical protein
MSTTSNLHRCGMCWPLMPTFVLISCGVIRRRGSGAVGTDNAHGFDVVVTGRILSRKGGRVPGIGSGCCERTTTTAIFGACFDVLRACCRGPPPASLYNENRRSNRRSHSAASSRRTSSAGRTSHSHQANSTRKSGPSRTRPIACRFLPFGNFRVAVERRTPTNVRLPLLIRTRRPSRWSKSAISDAYTARPSTTRLLRLLSPFLTTKVRFQEMHSFSRPIGPAGE